MNSAPTNPEETIDNTGSTSNTEEPRKEPEEEYSNLAGDSKMAGKLRAFLESFKIVRMVVSLNRNPFVNLSSSGDFSEKDKKYYIDTYQEHMREIKEIKEQIYESNIIFSTFVLTLIILSTLVTVPSVVVIVLMLSGFSYLLTRCGLSNEAQESPYFKCLEVLSYLTIYLFFASAVKSLYFMFCCLLLVIYARSKKEERRVTNILASVVVMVLSLLLVFLHMWLPIIEYSFLQIGIIQVIIFLVVMINLEVINSMLDHVHNVFANRVIKIDNTNSKIIPPTTEEKTIKSKDQIKEDLEKDNKKESTGILYILKTLTGYDTPRRWKIIGLISSIVSGLVVFFIANPSILSVWYKSICVFLNVPVSSTE